MSEPRDREDFDADVREAYRRPLDGAGLARRRAVLGWREAAARPRARGRRIANALGAAPRWATIGAFASLVLVGGWLAVRVGLRAPAPPAAPAGEATAAAAREPVTFTFRAPGATRVAVVGDFNGWDPDATPLHRAAQTDVWLAAIDVPAGVHSYAFVVDGRDWRADPAAPLAAVPAFGARNSICVVGEEAL